MCRYRNRLGVLLLLLVTGVQAGNKPTAVACSLPQKERELQTVLDQVRTEVDFTLMLERADGRRFSYSRGTSTPQTSYKSASSSKWVSSIVILRLVEQGYLKLSDKPRDLIPGWPIAAADPLYNMTLEQLLSFTSGLNEEPVCMNLGRADFENCVTRIASKNAGSGITSGSQFYYAGTHLQVAGLMAVKARGLESWQALFNEFQSQTGLFRTSAFDLPSAKNPRLAGGMHFNAVEYLDFLSALKNGKLLNPDSMAQLWVDRISGVSIASSPVERMGEDWHYGLGYWHECQNASFSACQAGARLSSPGSYGAYPYWDRDKNYIGFVARQGALGSFQQGLALERAARRQAEAWVACY